MQLTIGVLEWDNSFLRTLELSFAVLKALGISALPFIESMQITEFYHYGDHKN